MNGVDYLIIAIFALSMLAGLARGFVREMVSLITWIAAFVIAIMFANTLAERITTSATVQNLVNQSTTAIGTNTAQPVSYLALGISFAVLFLGTILIGAIIGYILNSAFQFGVLGVGNRLLGALFGFVRGFIITIVMIFVVQLTPFGKETWWQQSQLVSDFQPAVQWLANMVAPGLEGLKERFGQTVQGVGSKVQDGYQGFMKKVQ